jgi:DNA polymerase-4
VVTLISLSQARTILHVDMDAFFASVEQLDDPALRGKPVLVGGAGSRGVVSAASYEARVFGCRSAMPMAVARRQCPQAIVVPGRYWRYREVSDAMFDILGRYSPVVQPISVDEAFLDCTGCTRLHGEGPVIAEKIRRDIKSDLGLTASVGVAPNKFLAKLASDLNKPDGLTVIRPEDIDTLLPTLPVGRIWGVGPKMVERLASAGVKTIADLRRMDGEWFRHRFGSLAERIENLAHGRDAREVTPDHDAKSIGQEQTFGQDLAEPEALREVLLTQVEQVGKRLRRQHFLAGAVTVKIRFGDFQTITRSRTLREPTDVTNDLYEAARSLFDEWCRTSFSPVRLIGMNCSHFTQHRQLSLFDQPRTEKLQKVDRAVDLIKEKFGSDAIHRGKGRGRLRDD